MQKQKFLTANCEYEMLKMLEVSGGKIYENAENVSASAADLSVSQRQCLPPLALPLLLCPPLSILLRLALSLVQVQLNLPPTEFELISHAAHRGVGSRGGWQGVSEGRLRLTCSVNPRKHLCVCVCFVSACALFEIPIKNLKCAS